MATHSQEPHSGQDLDHLVVVRKILSVNTAHIDGSCPLTTKSRFPPLGKVEGSLSRVELIVGPLSGSESVSLPRSSRIQPV